MASSAHAAPAAATSAVLVGSERMADDAVRVRGYDFNAGVDHSALLASLLQTGFQATNLGLAIDQVRRMVRGRRTGSRTRSAPTGLAAPRHARGLTTHPRSTAVASTGIEGVAAVGRADRAGRDGRLARPGQARRDAV